MTLTEKTIKRLAYTGKPSVVFDDELPGFGIKINEHSMSFIAQRDIKGRGAVRVTLGRVGVLKAAAARDKAKAALLAMTDGVNPNEAARLKAARGITLKDALGDMLNSPKKRSSATHADYRKKVEAYLSDWLSKPLTAIDGSMVDERHRKIGREHGPYAANGTMRIFRAIYNSIAKKHADYPCNPCTAITWFQEKRRQSAIFSGRLADWHEAVNALENPIRRDYLLFVLHTGLRRESAASVRWDHVDFKRKVLHVAKTKGDKPFDLPLTDYLVKLLEGRKAGNKEWYDGSKFVFPARSKSGHISEPKESLGVKFSIHGLRATFTTAATNAKIAPYLLKILLNHAQTKQDVTLGYVNPSVDDLREPMETISRHLQALCSPPADDNVIKLAG